MKIVYRGPRDIVFVAPYGAHRKNEVKDYPDDFSAGLLSTSTKQHFEPEGDSAAGRREAVKAASGRADSAAPEVELAMAAKVAIDAGQTTADGRPTVAALEEILGRAVTAAERDRAVYALRAEG